jgi:benzoyl-CoA reductase subunit C
MEGLEPLAVLNDDPYAFAKQFKSKGGKAVGVTPMYFPEEMAHACGLLPVVLQESTEPITAGLSHVFPNFCAITRSNVDWAVKGRLDFLDAVVISDMCLQVRMGFGIASRHTSTPFIYLWWPPSYDAKRWLGSVMPRLERCRAALEDIAGARASEQQLRKSIDTYNENRRLLREVYRLRGEKPDAIRAREMQLLTIASQVMPKEEHNALLRSVLDKLQRASASADGRVRLFLSGHLCHRVKPEILDLVEEAGAAVVGDDLYAGARYYAAEVAADGNPMQALALRWFNPGLPCPTKGGGEADWSEYLIASVRASGAQGILSLMPRFCEPHMFYYPYLKERLLQAGIPFTFVETEHEAMSLEGVRTRVHALVETLKRGGR